VFLTFGEKKKVDIEFRSSGTMVGDVNLESRNEGDGSASRYFGKRREEGVKLTEVLSGLLKRLKSLDKERTNLVDEIERLGEEAEKEAAEQEKELSTLKEEVSALREVLEEMRSRRRI
jgi:chromosome segregation ATPase